MLLFKQLQFVLFPPSISSPKPAPQGAAVSKPPQGDSEIAPPFPEQAPPHSGQDAGLEAQARQMLRTVGATKLIPLLRVEWNPKLRTAAGRADSHQKLVTLNPRLHAHGNGEIDRTLRHELAHLLAQARAGRRRIPPHGSEWRQACRDLGIADEQRCHTLPFPAQARVRHFLYRCPRCESDFPRVHRIRRSVACLACCRRYNRGRYDQKYQLRLVRQRTNG